MSNLLKQSRLQVSFKKGLSGEMVRFALVGIAATSIHYALYYVLQLCIDATVAYTIGYGISFVCNFWLTSRFTFKRKATAKRGIGFIGSHTLNYLMQVVLLNVALYMGVPPVLAPVPVYCICIPTNFILVRYVFKRG